MKLSPDKSKKEGTHYVIYKEMQRNDFLQRFSREETGAHAMEIVQDTDGQWYITRCGHGKKGWWIAPLTWPEVGPE